MEELKLDLQFFAQGDDQDKTEEPTPHRRREARRRGQVMKSAELNSALNMLGMLALFMVMGSFLINSLLRLQRLFLLDMIRQPLDEESVISLARLGLQEFLNIEAPVLAVALLLGLLSNIAQVGFLVQTETMKPQLSRINPLEGLKRIFSRRALFELLKALAKISIMAVISFLYLKGRLPVLLSLFNQETGVVAVTLGRTILGLGFRIAGLFLVLALLDYLYQRHEFQKELRMSKQEVKEEYKQLEGDPHVRSRLRERQRALTRQRMLSDVPQASVVITNPTELAVALRYRENIDEAPVVVAKGAAVLAQRIKEIAREKGVPIVEDRPLARILFRQVEVGEEIPVELYQAVAEILALVLRMKEEGRRRGA